MFLLHCVGVFLVLGNNAFGVVVDFTFYSEMFSNLASYLKLLISRAFCLLILW